MQNAANHIQLSILLIYKPPFWLWCCCWLCRKHYQQQHRLPQASTTSPGLDLLCSNLTTALAIALPVPEGCFGIPRSFMIPAPETTGANMMDKPFLILGFQSCGIQFRFIWDDIFCNCYNLVNNHMWPDFSQSFTCKLEFNSFLILIDCSALRMKMTAIMFMWQYYARQFSALWSHVTFHLIECTSSLSIDCNE